jgi:hypothetical protein
MANSSIRLKELSSSISHSSKRLKTVRATLSVFFSQVSSKAALAWIALSAHICILFCVVILIY